MFFLYIVGEGYGSISGKPSLQTLGERAGHYTDLSYFFCLAVPYLKKLEDLHNSSASVFS